MTIDLDKLFELNDIEKLKERFDANWIPEPNSGCWLWTGRLWGRYPRLRIAWEDGTTKRVKGHRLSWRMFRGLVSTDLNVLHKCDVPICVNPNHLFLGTQKNNVHDMIAKGRANFEYAHTPKNRERIREAGRGFLLSEEGKAHIRANLERCLSEESKAKRKATWRNKLVTIN